MILLATGAGRIFSGTMCIAFGVAGLGAMLVPFCVRKIILRRSTGAVTGDEAGVDRSQERIYRCVVAPALYCLILIPRGGLGRRRRAPRRAPSGVFCYRGVAG
jgi:hypothetical protein